MRKVVSILVALVAIAVLCLVAPRSSVACYCDPPCEESYDCGAVLSELRIIRPIAVLLLLFTLMTVIMSLIMYREGRWVKD